MDDAPAIITGFMNGLKKEAGLSDGQAWGTVLWFAELGGMDKTAGSLGTLMGIKPAGQAAKNMVDNIKNLKDQAWDSGQQTVRKFLEPVGQDIEKRVDTGARAGARTGMEEAVANSPEILWNKAKAYFTNSENLKAIAPYAVAGLGSYAAAKMMGADGGTAALTGLAGGALGGYGYNNWDSIKKNFEPAPKVEGNPQVQKSHEDVAAEKHKNHEKQTSEGAANIYDTQVNRQPSPAQ